MEGRNLQNIWKDIKVWQNNRGRLEIILLVKQEQAYR